MLFKRARPAVQQCPICGAKQSLDDTRCTRCGAALNGIPINAGDVTVRPTKRNHTIGVQLEGPITLEWHEGEADLQEAELPALSWPILLIGITIVAVVAGALVYLLMQSINSRNTAEPTISPQTSVAAIEPTSDATPRSTAPPTNTRIVILPTPSLATVTPMPPTPTITPTRGPCVQKVKPGDTISGLAAKCGHHDIAIVQVILDLNNIPDANQLQVGQTLEIPWPTPTGGAPAPGNGATAVSGGSANNEPTLPPGVMWYTVKKGDDAISIAVRFHMDMKALRDLNPEMQFLTCDFGLPSGGASCVVQVFEGQHIRVQAPTPTPTLSPTPSGSETATPTRTPTFNAPFSQSPDDNMPFEATELPVLRWVASGELSATQVYLVRVRDVDLNVTYSMTTRDLSFQIPPDWGPTDGKRHTFEWSVSVADLNASGTPIPTTLTTDIRTFTWQSR